MGTNCLLIQSANMFARKMLSRFRLGIIELEINMGTHRKVARQSVFVLFVPSLATPRWLRMSCILLWFVQHTVTFAANTDCLSVSLVHFQCCLSCT